MCHGHRDQGIPFTFKGSGSTEEGAGEHQKGDGLEEHRCGLQVYERFVL